MIDQEIHGVAITIDLRKQVAQVQSMSEVAMLAELEADGLHCPDCGDPREACICKSPVKFYVAEPAPPAHKPRTAVVHQALKVVPSRFHLAGMASVYVRKAHRPGEDVAKTIRRALEYIASDGEAWPTT